ncbi:aminoacetone oxidase family FAD-binding enzyme, partial [Klebsiella oxytoca]
DLDEYFTQYPDRLKHCLERFDTEDTITFFQGIGLLVKSRNGYLYPACEQAAAVLDVLRYEVAELNVHVITAKKITGIEAGGKKG